MVTVPEANRTLWKALDDLYAEQHQAVLRIQQAIARIGSSHPEVVRDPLARDALRAAIARQDGINRYADSQLALAQTMRSYWEQRVAALDSEPMPLPLPLVPRTAPAPLGAAGGHGTPRTTVAE